MDSGSGNAKEWYARMSANPPNLDRIKVQTARMLEIYDLLQGKIANNAQLNVPDGEQNMLRETVRTVEKNMLQIQEFFAEYQEENAPVGSEAQELEEIVNSVLEWCASHTNSE